MNIVNFILKRREGFESTCDYDIALLRLKCFHNDVYYGMAPNQEISYTNPEPPLFVCRFCTTPGYEELIALANEDGKLAFQNTKNRKSKEIWEGLEAHRNAIFDITWMPGEPKLVTVSGDHTARLWDVSMHGSTTIKEIGCFHAHTRSVKTAVFRYQDKAVFATGARDGSIMIWDIRASHTGQQCKPDNCIKHAHNIGYPSCTARRTSTKMSRTQSITGLVFQDDLTLLSCAAGDGLIKVWDLRKIYTVYKKEPIAKCQLNYGGNIANNGFSSLAICPARITLFASCMDNNIYAYNISSYNPKPVTKYYGHQNHTYYVKTCLSPDGRYLASGSSDAFAYMWNINKPGVPLIKLFGHTQEVTCVAWCNTGEIKIVTCSDDAYHRIWRVGLEHRMENEEIDICGQAESILDEDLENMKLVSIAGTSNKDDLNQHKDNHNSNNTSVRFHPQMMALSPENCILSPRQENLKVFAQQPHNYSVQGLVSPSTGPNTTLNKYNYDEPSTSQSAFANENARTLSSFTSDLPNFVMDGTAPHLLQISPQKCKENDWLTKIRKERYQQRVSKNTIDKPCSPKTQIAVRRSNKPGLSQIQKETKTTKNPVSLLNFFKVAGSKDCEKTLSSENTNVIPSKSMS